LTFKFNKIQPGTVEYRFIGTTDPEYPKERSLRSHVLILPFGIPPGVEVFPTEDKSYHLVAVDEGQVVGCAIFIPEDKTGRICQMAVEPTHQKRGVGTTLMSRLEDRLKEEGFENAYLHARHYAVGFYERMGYTVEGEPFEEVGMEHSIMRKALED